MHVLFVAPEFPADQRRYVRALKDVGAHVTGIGEVPVHALPEQLKADLGGYEQVHSVCDEQALYDVVKRVQARGWVDRLEATVEAHVMVTARVREAATIPGLSAKAAYLCRDKPTMKAFLRERGVPTAAARPAQRVEEALELAAEVGFPLIVKPRDGAGASGTTIVRDAGALHMRFAQLPRGGSLAVEELVEGHEGFYDTLTIGGEVVHEFVSHYYPNVLEAMSHRWISPQIVATNRLDAEGYDEVKALGRKVVKLLDIGTSATHMEWFFGPKGLRFSEIGARAPGVGQWDLYGAANDIDMYREWAHGVVHRAPSGTRPSRRFSAGIIALRPDRDGVIDRYEGADEIHRKFGQYVYRAHLPSPGTPTQPVAAG
jgi:hypothetical protein